MDKVDKRGNILHLVSLQAADKVPLNILRKHLLLGSQLLHPALTEASLVGAIGFKDCITRVKPRRLLS